MSARITGNDLRYPKFAARVLMASEEAVLPRQFVLDLAAQVDADEREKASLATRLAEAERRGKVWEERAEGHRADRNRLWGELGEVKAELARLRPLAEQWQAVEKVRNHPLRYKGAAFGWGADMNGPDGRAYVEVKGEGVNTWAADTMVGLARALDDKMDRDARAAKPKPEPEEDWVFQDHDGTVYATTYRTPAEVLKEWDDDKGRPMRRSVDPVTGVVTLTPAPAPDTRNEGE